MKVSSFFKPLSFLPAILLMYMIFSLSGQAGDTSASTSYKVSKAVVKTVNTVGGMNWDDWKVEEYANSMHGPVRKLAHFTEYLLLAIAVSFPLYVYGVRGIFLMLLAGMICIGFACGDEYHQASVAGRNASARDVMIDSIGVLVGIIITRLIGWSGRMAITGPAYERRQKKQQRELDEREAELLRREQALRREEMESRRLRRNRSFTEHTDPRLNAPHNGYYHSTPSPDGTSHSYEDVHEKQPIYYRRNVSDKTRVIGPENEIDDRTRVYRTEAERQKLRAEYEMRRRMQSQDLQDDNTSDQLSDDLPLSGLFKSKKRNRE